MVLCIDQVTDILTEHGVCTHREIKDRIRSNYKINASIVNKTVGHLFNSGLINRQQVKTPYNGRQCSFYFNPGLPTGEMNEIIQYKMNLIVKQSEVNDLIGRFGEVLVARLLGDLGYTEIETRKRQHNGIGFRRMGLDVWCCSLWGNYCHIEVKNRKQPVGYTDVDHIIDKTSKASNLWSLPIMSSLVCTFIHPTALEYASALDVPVVITRKQFVPLELSELFLEIKKAFGSYYIEPTALNEPPKYLRDLIEERILWQSPHSNLEINAQELFRYLPKS